MINKNQFFVLVLMLLFNGNVLGQPEKQTEIVVPNIGNSAWWSGVINQGHIMPLHDGYFADFKMSNYGNQVQPMLISNQGHLIWSEKPFEISLNNDTLKVISKTSSLEFSKPGSNLKEAFQYAVKNYFPPQGQLPDELLFSAPQYNTWIELMYDQNQEDILNYARQIIDNGFPPGVLMIDDNWQEDYGKWDFHPGRFNDPEAMMDSLHQMGFKVMLWMCPFVSPDCDVYRMLRDRQMLLRDETGRAAIVRWWNGASGLLDLSNSETQEWFKDQLDYLQDFYHVDGFKFDAGDFPHYKDCYSGTGKASPQEQCEWYARIGLDYPLNEYRAMWKMAGYPLVNRLRDKAHNWEDLNKLIPHILLQGIVGYNFTCPDMVGGGEFTSFLPGKVIDQDLIVRSTQCHALMPMMQFSVAPWRILDEEHHAACKEAVAIREEFTPIIMDLVRESARTGEPIVRSMEYVFPHQGYEKVNDQFLLGNEILVAPMLEKGKTNRVVLLPKGKWKERNGKKISGPKSLIIDVGINDVPIYIKIK
jgi:alpha-glucosidase